MSVQNFQELSYQIHEQTYVNVKHDEEINLYASWFSNGTVDVWRHLRMLKNLNPFLDSFPGAKWLTVGDGRFATSAIYINERGGEALPTDIDLTLLKIAKEKKMISKYEYANAEDLPFDNNSFDFTFCKESFHHFPRPYIALYEMIRVSRKAVILVEPRDWIPSPLPRKILQLSKNLVRKITGQSIPHPDTGNYEPIGNYVYTISPRELQKVASGLNFPCVGYKDFHDVYIEGVEYEKADSRSHLFKQIKRKLFLNEVFYQLGLNGKNQVVAIIFKERPGDDLRKSLLNEKIRIIDLPQNPYVNERDKSPLIESIPITSGYRVNKVVSAILENKFTLKIRGLRWYLLGRWRIRRAIQKSSPLKIILGASITGFPNWISTDLPHFNILKIKDWQYLFEGKQADNMLAEHVLEHLTDKEVEQVIKNAYEFLKPNGCLRIAVPDQWHPDPEYIEFVRPGGSGAGADDHKSFWNIKSLSALLNKYNFEVQPLEYCNEHKEIITSEFSDRNGIVRRSKSKNFKCEIDNYSSLIVDAIKK